MKRVGMALLVGLVLVGCTPTTETATDVESADAPAAAAAIQTIEDMHAAAESGDWERYVVDFYGEQHKFGSADDRRALVARFRDQWGSEVTAALGRAKGAAPRIDGSRAIFEVDGEVMFVLHLSDDGRWTFHL